MLRALSLLRALVLLLIVALSSNAGAVDDVLSVGQFYMRSAVAQWSDRDAIDYATSYYTPNPPENIIKSVSMGYNVSTKIPFDAGLKPFFAALCDSPTTEGDYCQQWTAYFNRFRNTMSTSDPGDPGFLSSPKIMDLGSCLISPASFSKQGLPARYTLRWAYGRNGGEEAELYNGDGVLYAFQIGYVGQAGQRDYAQAWIDYYNKACIKPQEWLTWARTVQNLSDSELAKHIRIYMYQWISKQDTPTKLASAIYNVFTPSEPLKDPNAPCDASACPGYTPPSNGTGGNTGNTGGTGTTCTTPTGGTSTNQYDCAPVNPDTKCSIIDLPCNFAPKVDWASKFGTVWDSIGQRAPLGYFKLLDFKSASVTQNGFSNQYDDTTSRQMACPDQELNYLNPLGGTGKVTFNWCNSNFADYWHTNIRDLLSAFISILSVVAAVRMVTTS